MNKVITLDTPGLNKRQKDFLNPLILAGFSLDQEWIQTEVLLLASPIAKRRKEKAEQHETKIREAEGVLLSLHFPSTLEEHKCKNCQRIFLTNYRYNRHCSDECLKATLDRMGLRWNPDKTAEDRWGGEPPTIISPETLVKLREWARKILAQEETLNEEISTADDRVNRGGIQLSNQHYEPPSKFDATRLIEIPQQVVGEDSEVSGDAKSIWEL